MDHPDSTDVTHMLNLCDRVEILDEMIHNKDLPLSSDNFQTILESHYSCFVRLCEDLRGPKRTKQVTAVVTDAGVDFEVKFDDETVQQYSYPVEDDLS